MILNVDLFWRPGSFWFRLSRSTGMQGIFIIMIDRVVVSMTLPFGGVDPRQPQLFLLLKVLTHPIIRRFRSKVLKIVNAKFRIPILELFRSLLTSAKDIINGIVTDCSSLSFENLLRSMLHHVKQFIFRRGFGRSDLRTTLLNDELIESEFLCGTFKDFFLDGVFSHESVDVDLFCLSDSMSSVHGLEICLGIPVTVV